MAEDISINGMDARVTERITDEIRCTELAMFKDKTDGRQELAREYEQFHQLLAPNRPVTLTGSISDGMGKGKEFISLPGYAEQFVENLGYEPFAGTLNVRLDDDSIAERSRLEDIDGIEIESWTADGRTYGAATCYPARVETEAGEMYEPAHVLVPERTDHGDDQLEIIADSKLRDVLGSDNGEVITVDVIR